MTRLLPFGLLVLLLAPAPAAAGGGGGLCAGFSERPEVVLLDSCVDGTTSFVPAGPVTVRNDGYVEHNLTAIDDAFTTGTIAPGRTAEVDVEPGVHRVYCTLHGSVDGFGMAGVLVAGETASAAPASGTSTPAWLVAGFLGAVALALAVRGRPHSQPAVA